MKNKLQVTEAHILANAHDKSRVYFFIEYKEVGMSVTTVGFGSYYLDLVQKWFDEELEIVEPES